MKTKYVMAMAVAALFVLAAAPAPANASVSMDQPVASFGELSADHAGGYAEEWCDPDPQLALLVLDLPGCGDFGGDHTVGGFGYIIVGFTLNTASKGPLAFTGTTQALLEWSGGEVDFRCDWAGGQWTTCYPGGTWSWPPVGQTFTFSCQSLEGSLGHWGDCFVGHE